MRTSGDSAHYNLYLASSTLRPCQVPPTALSSMTLKPVWVCCPMAVTSGLWPGLWTLPWLVPAAAHLPTQFYAAKTQIVASAEPALACLGPPSGDPGTSRVKGRSNHSMRTYLTLTSHHLQPKVIVAAWAAWNSLPIQELDALPGEGGRATLSTGSSYSGDSGMLGTAEVAARATWAAWPRLQVAVQSLYQTPHPCSAAQS